MNRFAFLLAAILLCLAPAAANAQALTYRQRANVVLGHTVKTDGANLTPAKALRVLRAYWVIRNPNVPIPGPTLPLGPLTDQQAAQFTAPQAEQLSLNFIEGLQGALKQELLNVEARAAAQSAAAAKKEELDTLDLGTP